MLALLPLLRSSPARAQSNNPAPPNFLDLSLTDLMSIDIDSVYSASGFMQKVTEAPASVTIITSEEIQKYGYRTLADILRNVRGFYVSYDRNYSYVGIRGYGPPGDYNSRVALLVDGHRINDNIYESALIGTEFPIDVDLIDRVEVIRGPNSSQYIASAFLGVINVITKHGRDLPGLTVTEQAGSYRTFEDHVSYGDKFSNGLELLFSANLYVSHGNDRLFFPAFNAPSTNNGVAVAEDQDQFHQYFGSVSWRGLTVQGVYGSRDKQIPTASFGTVFDARNTQTTDRRGYLDLTYDRILWNGWSLTGRGYYDQYHSDGTYMTDYSALGGPSLAANIDLAHGSWWGEEVNVSSPAWHRQRLTVGSQFEANFQQALANYDLQPFHPYFNRYLNSHTESLFAQDEIHLRKNLILNLGLRYDHYSLFGAATNPRAALIYNPWERTTFKFLYGQSFRTPNLFELYYAAPGSQPDPSLRPETVRTMELVWEQYLSHHFATTVSAFYYPIHNLIGERVDPANQNTFFANTGSLDLRGLDFELKRSLAAGLEATLSYSFQDASSSNPENQITNSPRHLVQASVSAPIVKQKIFASMDLQYVSARATLGGQTAPAYVVPNFTVYSRNVLKHWEISASLYNAFNQKYFDPAGNGLTEDAILQDGRNFRVKVVYKLK